MPVFVADEIVTAAKLNLATVKAIASEPNSRTFTNTSYLDLDALTGGAGSIAAVSVSVVTGTSAIVIVSALLSNGNALASTVVSYRVSGATTIAATDNWGYSLRAAVASDTQRRSFVSHQTALTAGTNVFEMQARVSAGTGTVGDLYLTVIPI